MTKDQKFKLLISQIILGLFSAIIGNLFVIMCLELISTYSNVSFDQFYKILYTLGGGYIGILIGIELVSYKHLKRIGKSNLYFRFLAQSIIGFFIGFLLLILVFTNRDKLQLASSIVIILAILMPAVGAILGFNYNLHKLRDEN